MPRGYGKLTRVDAVSRITARYHEFVDLFEGK